MVISIGSRWLFLILRNCVLLGTQNTRWMFDLLYEWMVISVFSCDSPCVLIDAVNTCVVPYSELLGIVNYMQENKMLCNRNKPCK